MKFQNDVFYAPHPHLRGGGRLILVRIPSASASARRFLFLWRQRLRDTFLSAQYLVNQSLDSYQIYLDIYFGHDKILIGVGDIDLIFKVTAVEKVKIHDRGDISFLRKHCY